MPKCLQYWNPAGRVYRGPKKVITLLYGQPHVLICSTASGQQWWYSSKSYQILYSGIVEQRVSGRWWWTSWIASSLADIVVQKWDEKVKQRECGPLDIEKTSNPKNINSNRIRTKIFGQIHLGVLLKLPHKEELRVGNSPVLRCDSFILMLIFILILISRYLWRLYLSVIIFKFIFIPCPHPTRQHTWQLRRPGTKL